MNAGKERLVLQLLASWRHVAVLHGREQWRLFFEQGHFDKRLKSRTGYEIVGTSFGQMIRHQVVGVLSSFVANRSNDFRDAVHGSSLDSATKHQLHFINRWKAWFTLGTPLAMKDGNTISTEVRKLARAIMRGILRGHRKPNLSKIGMSIDQRMVSMSASRSSHRYGWWLRLSTLTKGAPVWVPLAHTDRMEARNGQRSLSIQVSQDRETKALRFGVLTDCASEFEASRQAYTPRCGTLALDVGLKTLLAANDGTRLGQGWDERLHWYESRITTLAKNLQRQGLRPNRSARYRAYVQQLRGWLQSEIGRVMNRMVETHAPAAIATELLDFRAPGLSRRLNRLIGTFGKRVLEAKLLDLEQRFGIELVKVNPAYSSQECNACGYVDKRNRPRQSVFRCLWCGSKRNGDVNAACNLWSRRSAPPEAARRHRQSILADLVQGFNARHPRPRVRHTGTKGRAADPRWSNAYFKAWTDAVGSTGLHVDSTR
jgi:putative transposase